MKSHRGKAPLGRKLDMVGVAGSTPAAWTTFPKLKPGQGLTIPSGYTVTPALEWTKGSPRPYWVVTNNSRKTREKPVNGKRRSRSA